MGKSVAIVLSAGKGKRMQSNVSKQYLLMRGKPVICYALDVFECCDFIDEIVLVCGEDDILYCTEDIVKKYGFSKVHSIVAGGKERYHSVHNGLQAIQQADHVYIHDGARPFVTEEMLTRAKSAVEEYGACVLGMPVKDTIKIADDNGFASQTPPRSHIWQIQTPQVFSYPLVKSAYEKLIDALEHGVKMEVTDDAMVVETMTDCKVKLVEGSYTNIKITTPEDMKIAETMA